jgi:hypothetical protein
MSNKSLSLDALKSHLFETLEGVKNLSDPAASDNEKISVEQAKQIVDISGKIIDIYKVQVDALKTFSGMDNVGSLRSLATGIGVATEETVRQIEAT